MRIIPTMVSQVAVVKCGSYDESEVEEAVGRLLSLLGGIGCYIKPGDRVLLKPNLLSASDPGRAITTHPAVLKAVVRAVQAAGGKPLIADSPGGPFNRGSLESAYAKSGFKAVAEETGAELNYNTCSMVAHYPEGVLLKRVDLLAILDEVDVVITLPKMKTHMLTTVTGAVKINFGLVPGLTKPAYHLKFQSKELFADMLLDLLLCVKPRLALMDAVVGLEGDGPGSHGTPRKTGLLLGSADALALDVACADIMCIPPLEVSTTQRAVLRGLTSGRAGDLTVVGERLDDVRVQYRKPSGKKGVIGTFISSRLINRMLLDLTLPYPVANSACVRCGVCKQSCPAAAITITDKAYMDRRKCIRCYCCHELCPHKAVSLKRILRFPGR